MNVFLGIGLSGKFNSRNVRDAALALFDVVCEKNGSLSVGQSIISSMFLITEKSGALTILSEPPKGNEAYTHGVFIGSGLDLVRDFDLFKSKFPSVPIFSIGSTGDIANELTRTQEPRLSLLDENRKGYHGVFRDFLTEVSVFAKPEVKVHPYHGTDPRHVPNSDPNNWQGPAPTNAWGNPVPMLNGIPRTGSL